MFIPRHRVNWLADQDYNRQYLNKAAHTQLLEHEQNTMHSEFGPGTYVTVYQIYGNWH